MRKTAPKLETPFKCYIYETKAQFVKSVKGACTKYGYGKGKVIGEFICNQIDAFWAEYYDNGSADLTPSKLIGGLGNANEEMAYLKKCCLSHEELFDYIIDNHFGYGWHISDLKIYDKPKELGEFKRECKQYFLEDPDCENCKYEIDKASVDCKCINIRQALNQVKFSGLGNIFRKCTFETFKCQQQWQGLLKDKALEFITSSSNCFFVGGGSGSGKSHICTAIVGLFLKKGKNINYVQWLDLVDDLNNSRYRKVEKYDSIMQGIKDTEILYIDDFLKGDNAVKPSSADIKLAYRIINARYVKSRSEDSKRYITIISSEWTLENINKFDAATGGRIMELARDFTISVKGADKNQRMFVCM